MTEQKHDVKNVKEVLALGFALGSALKRSQADGKLDAMDLVNLIPVMSDVGPALEDIKLVPTELKDLDAEEAKELMDFARSKLPDVTDDSELVIKIEKGIRLALAVGELVAVL